MDILAEQTEPPLEPFISEICFGNTYIEDIYIENHERSQTININMTSSGRKDNDNFSCNEMTQLHTVQVDQLLRIRKLTIDLCD